MTQKTKEIVILMLIAKAKRAKSLLEAEKIIDRIIEISKTEVDESEDFKTVC